MQQFERFEQGRPQLVRFPSRFSEGHGQEFALFGVGSVPEHVAGVASEPHHLEGGRQGWKLGVAGRS